MHIVLTATSTLVLLLQTAAAATLRQALPPLSATRSRRLQSTTPNDGDLRFNEATFIASHNSHATLAVAQGILEPLGATQDDSLIDQLTNDGVRGLLLDIMINEEEEEELRLVHANSFITLDYGGFRTSMGASVIPFLEDDENAIISLFMETDGDDGADAATVRAAILGHLQAIFSSMTVNGTPLKDMTFKYNHELWKDHEDWPTLDEIRKAGQRIFVFTDRTELVDSEYGIMYNRHVMQENHWEGIDECESRYMWGSAKTSLPSNSYWTRLFFMNHFCCGSGPSSKSSTVGQSLIGGGNNGWGILYNRVKQCISNNGGSKPNFIALDWVSQSEEAKKIRDFLNFGGRLGTGQTCESNWHCATSSCNLEMGVCQCQQCPSDSVDVCLGCETGQFCSSVDGGINACQDEEGGSESISLSLPASPPVEFLLSNLGITMSPVGLETSQPTTQVNTAVPIGSSSNSQPVKPPLTAPTSSPIKGEPASSTQGPTEDNASDSFYCGDSYFDTVSGCNKAVKCPGGNDDCPDGQTCFAGVECTLSPVQFPSGMPSDGPSSVSLASQASNLNFGDGDDLTFLNTKFCGIELEYTKSNCRESVPCPGRDGDDSCGVGYTCFSNIVCDFESPLTPEKTALTKAPADWETSPPAAQVAATASTGSPSLNPTIHFDFSNTYYCGANFTDAEENCYNNNIPCPTQSPTICGGGTCYGGITCTVPPTSLPTTTPTPGPKKSNPQASPSKAQTRSPFEIASYGNYDSGSTVILAKKAITGKLVTSIIVGIEILWQFI